MFIDDIDILGAIIVGAVALAIVAVTGITHLPSRVKTLLFAAVTLRFCGAFGREMIARDSVVYFDWGKKYAEYFSRWDLSPFYDPDLMRHEAWIGTNFVGYPTGLVISLIGPSWTGTFFAFGLISFLGLLAIAVAFRRTYSDISFESYWAWLFLIPSLWFWPSSIGKESLMLLGLGVATLGLAGRYGRANWIVFFLGLALVACIRPQVAAIFLFATTISYWLNFDSWNSSDLLAALTVMAVGLFGVWLALDTTLEGNVSIEAFGDYVEYGQQQSGQGGSEVDQLGTEPANIPMAFVNVLFRPFIWEAHSIPSVIAAAEVLLIWGLIFLRRRELMVAIRMWRHDRMLRFAIPFLFLYTIALGMVIANLGIVARQRVLIFPYLFWIVETGSYYLKSTAFYHEQLWEQHQMHHLQEHVSLDQ